MHAPAVADRLDDAAEARRRVDELQRASAGRRRAFFAASRLPRCRRLHGRRRRRDLVADGQLQREDRYELVRLVTRVVVVEVDIEQRAGRTCVLVLHLNLHAVVPQVGHIQPGRRPRARHVEPGDLQPIVPLVAGACCEASSQQP